MSMSNLNVRPTSSPAPNPSAPSAPTRVAPTAAPQAPQAAPISQEAQQMVRQASQATTTPTVATDADIEGIKNEISSLTSALPSVNEFSSAANTLMDTAVSKAKIGDAITTLGDQHPNAASLRTQLTEAGDDPAKLRTVRNAVVTALRQEASPTNPRQLSAHEAVDRRMASERSPADDRSLIRRAVIGGRDRSVHAEAQQGRLTELSAVHADQAGQLTKLANSLQDRRANAPALRGAISALGDHPRAAALKAELTAAGSDPAKLMALRNKVVDTLRGESNRMKALGQAELQGSERIGNLSGEGAEELIANASMATSMISSTNSIMKLAGATEGFMGAAASAVGAGFGGLQIVTEAVALRRNVGRLNEALTRRESAQLVLAPAADRGKMIAEMNDQIASLSKPSMFRTKAGREADIEKLKAKITALQAMGPNEASPQAKAIAQQVVDTTSVKFKALRVLKNVVGIAAGAIAIAVAVGALATPVGWVAAGVALTATVGLWAYNKYQTSSKEGKIENLMQNRGQIAHQIADLEHSPAARNPQTPQGQALAGLRDLQQKNLVQLLTVSPRHAANEIIGGLKKTPPDEQMRVLATQVLNVPRAMTVGPFSLHQETELQEYMMRGMPMQPKL